MKWSDSGCLAGNNHHIATLQCVFPLFQNIINAALGLAGVVALIFIIYAGIKLLLSAGDAKKVASARNTLTYAILGLLLVFVSFAIVFFISTLTGVDCIRMFGFDNCGLPNENPHGGIIQPSAIPIPTPIIPNGPRPN